MKKERRRVGARAAAGARLCRWGSARRWWISGRQWLEREPGPAAAAAAAAAAQTQWHLTRFVSQHSSWKPQRRRPRRDGAAAQHHAGVGARDWVRQYPLGTVPRALPHPVGCTWFGRGERRRCALRLLMAGVDSHDRCAQFKYSSRSASQASLCSRTRVPLRMAAHSRN